MSGHRTPDPAPARVAPPPPTLEQMRAAYRRLLNALSAGNRLTAEERRALRWLRRQPGVHQPSDPREFLRIANARLKRQRRQAKRLDDAQGSATPEDPA